METSYINAGVTLIMSCIIVFHCTLEHHMHKLRKSCPFTDSNTVSSRKFTDLRLSHQKDKNWPCFWGGTDNHVATHVYDDQLPKVIKNMASS